MAKPNKKREGAGARQPVQSRFETGAAYSAAGREIFRRFAAAAGAEERARLFQSLHAAGRGGAFGPGDRCRRQQGDARRCSRSPTRRRRWWRSGEEVPELHPHHRAVPQQGEERHRAVGEAGRRVSAARCRQTARRSRRCRASAARPPTSSSTSPSASRPWRSTPISSASPTAPASRPARDPLEVERRWSARARRPTCITPITG